MKHHGQQLDTVGGFQVIDCVSCGFKHILPIPTPQELEELYRTDYYSVQKPLYVSHHIEDIVWWNIVYNEQYDFLERELRNDMLSHTSGEWNPQGKRWRILDIGSGAGFFLQCGRHRGWEALGIEPSCEVADHAWSIGVETVNEFLTEDNVDKFGTFDVVHLHEVLEHVPDPASMLKLAHQLLNPRGIICVIVPNDYNPLQKILREKLNYKSWWVAPPHHINYFDFDSLERLIERCWVYYDFPHNEGYVPRSGFEVIHKTATFPMEFFLLMGDNYVGNDTLGRQCHSKRKKLEIALGSIKEGLYDSLAELKIGREIVMYGRKNVRE